jgi:RNA polymerase sigma-70 factor (ECF subfamily)
MPGEFRGHQPEQHKSQPETREEIEARLIAYKPMIKSLCGMYLKRNPKYYNDLEDVIQDVMMKAFVNWNTLEKEESREAWLTSIAKNASIDSIRRKNNKFKNPDNFKSIDDLDEGFGWDKKNVKSAATIKTWPTYEIDLTNKRIADFVFSVLSPEEKKIIRMQIVKDIPVEKIAEITGINENTVKVKLLRARKKMYEAYLKQQRIIKHNKQKKNPDIK